VVSTNTASRFAHSGQPGIRDRGNACIPKVFVLNQVLRTIPDPDKSHMDPVVGAAHTRAGDVRKCRRTPQESSSVH
jgi:hypothetical protein